jgi:uncharacterized protein YceK
MKQLLISFILLVFLSGCSVHMHRPQPYYVKAPSTVYVTKYKTRVIHKKVYKHKTIHKHYRYIPKKRKKVIIRYY